jgi:hypothetical protein
MTAFGFPGEYAPLTILVRRLSGAVGLKLKEKSLRSGKPMWFPVCGYAYIRPFLNLITSLSA